MFISSCWLEPPWANTSLFITGQGSSITTQYNLWLIAPPQSAIITLSLCSHCSAARASKEPPSSVEENPFEFIIQHEFCACPWKKFLYTKSCCQRNNASNTFGVCTHFVICADTFSWRLGLWSWNGTGVKILAFGTPPFCPFCPNQTAKQLPVCYLNWTIMQLNHQKFLTRIESDLKEQTHRCGQWVTGCSTVTKLDLTSCSLYGVSSSSNVPEHVSHSLTSFISSPRVHIWPFVQSFKNISDQLKWV